VGSYIAKRLAWGVVSCFVLTFTTYVIFFQIPADPARFLVRNPNPSESQLIDARERLGLDEPFLVQYGKFVWRALHLDFGVAYQSLGQGSPVEVTTIIKQAAPVTASLALGGAIVFLALAIRSAHLRRSGRGRCSTGWRSSWSCSESRCTRCSSASPSSSSSTVGGSWRPPTATAR